MSDVHIVKVQRCLSPPSGPALICGPDHSLMQQQELAPAHLLAIGHSSKAYFTATYSDGRWHLIERVEDQPW
jgi:hypothetical protein